MKKIIFAIIFSFIFAATALAHQPRLIYDQPGEITIEAPTISKAYYDELNGTPRTYKFSLTEPTEVYLNVLVPDLADSQKNYSFKVMQNGQDLFDVSGQDYTWEQFYEPFGGDNYWKGPEIKNQYEKGDYTVVVSNPENKGKYVLAAGDIESFPLNESVKTLQNLPELKKDYFGKSSLSAFNNYIGLFLGGLILVGAILIVGIILIVKRIRRKK